METKPGTIILLNGVGSAGKTSIARALQDVFDGPLLLVGIDTFMVNISPRRYHNRDHKDEGFAFVPVEGADPPETAFHTGPFGHLLMSGMHRTIATLAAMGHNVVVDHVFWEQRWLDECVDLWRDFPVLFVGMRCPLPVAEARLYAREDRSAAAKGTTRWQFPRTHAHAIYDLEVDTSTATAIECAVRINRHLDEGLPLTAFQRLASRAATEPT